MKLNVSIGMKVKSKSQIKRLLQFKIIPPHAIIIWAFWQILIVNGGKQDIKLLWKKLHYKFWYYGVTLSV